MKRILLLSFSCAALYLSLTSYSNGPSLAGHATAQSGCNVGGGCHGPSNSATTASILLIKKSSGDTVKNNEYEPGETYTLVVGGTNFTAAGFGFILRSSHTSGTMQAGTFGTNVMPATSTKTQGVSPFTVFEHKSIISPASGGFEASVDWTAPADSTGDVTMHLSVNAVNSNGNTGGDQWASTSATFAEKPTSIAQVNNVSLSVYPNPATSTLYIKSNNSYNYVVIGLNGSIELNGTGNTIDVSSLATGMHILKLSDGKQIQTITFNKL